MAATETVKITAQVDENNQLAGIVIDFCDFRCMAATGPDCECHVCGGWNHGVLNNA
jgi:hypothetical protein